MLSDIENDKTSPKVELLDKVAQKLNVPVTHLLPPATGTTILNNNNNDHSNGIVHNYNNEHNNDAILDVLAKVLETQNRLIALLDKQGK